MPAESVRRNRTRQLWLEMFSFTTPVIAAKLFAGEATNPIDLQFKFERYGAQGGALYRSSGFATNNDDNVNSVLVDSIGRLWVGTVTGLAVYDGEKWLKRTFPVRGLSPVVGAAFRVLQISHCGPDKIVEGPPGTIWFGGRCGVWCFRDGEFKEINSGRDGLIQAMAVDQQGVLWIVNKQRVEKFDGGTWNTVLCPYVGKPKSVEATGLNGIVIDRHGHVWIGGTVYGNPTGPWESEGPTWLVDQQQKQRGDGPPMAPLFEFDGKRWRAFGPTEGLNVKWAIPKLNAQGQIGVKTSNNYFVREDGIWRATQGTETDAGKRWILRDGKRGQIRGYSELLFRDGQRLFEVQPANAKTGELLDIRSEQLALLHIAEDPGRGCVWLGTPHGLYKIWLEKKAR